MIAKGGEVNEVAILFKGRNSIGNGLCRFRRSFVDDLSYLLQDLLNFRGKVGDIFVDGKVLFAH